MKKRSKVSGLEYIFKFYDVNKKTLIKIKPQNDKSIYLSIPQSNVAILNGRVLGEEEKPSFKTFI